MVSLFNRKKRFRNLPQILLSQSNGATGERFGNSVALSEDGNTAIVGTWGDNVGGNGSQGSVTIFTRTSGVWSEQQNITQSGGATDDNFGISVSLSADGNTAIVGASGDTVGGTLAQGSATVFTRSGGVWSQQQFLTKSDGAALDRFGISVALSGDGNTAIVGAYSDDVGANSNQGSATVFTRSGSTWTEQQILTKSDGAAADFFGGSVALSSNGNTALVSAAEDTVGGNQKQGSVTVFTRTSGTWTEQQILTKSDGAFLDYFGRCVLSSDGNTAIVSTSLDNVGANPDQGSATVFTRTGSTWTQQQILTKSDGEAYENFGNSVALSGDGNTAIVGAWSDNVGGNANQGSVIVFTRSGSTWTQQQIVTQFDGEAGDRFGSAVALSGNGNIAIVTASHDSVGGIVEKGSATILYRR